MLLLALPERSTAQQQIYWRGDTGSTVWWNDGDKPWYYANWNSTENRPDIWPIPTRNFLNFDNNNQTVTTVNGATFQIASLRIHGTSTGRTFNNSSGQINVSVGITNDVSHNHTFNVDIILGDATVNFTGNTGNNMTFNNALTLGANKALFGGSSSTASFTFAGVVSGSGGQIELDNGFLVLSGNNTYTGTTAVDGGTLEVTANNALGSNAAGTTVANGATLDFKNVNYSTTEGVTLNGGTIATTTGTSTFAGGVTLGAHSIYNVTGTQLTQSGVITDGASAFNITKNGSGTLLLSGNNTYDGTTTISAGTVAVSLNNALGSTSNGTTVATGATLDFQNVSYSTTESVTVNGGTIAASTGTSTFAGAVTLGANSVFNVGGTQLTQSGIINDGANSFSLTKSGGGTLLLNASNTYDGGTAVSAGTILAANSGALGTSGTVTVSANAILQLSNNITVARALNLSGDGGGAGALRNVSGTNTWSAGITNTSGARINADTNTALIISGNISNAASQTLYLGGNGNITNTGTITGTLTTGNGAVFKDGSGTLTLSANNSGLTGLFRMRQGTVSITNANSLGSGSLEFGDSDTTNNRITLLINSNTTITNRFEIANNSGGGTIDVASGQTATLTGVLSQTNGTANTTKIAKGGAGILLLGGTGSTFGGQIQIGNGTVIIGQSGSFGTNTTTAQRGIDLGLDISDINQTNNVSLLASNNVTISNSIYVAPNTNSVTRTIGLSGNGTNTFSSEFYMDGTLTVDAGTLATDRVNISGAMVNTGGLIKTGSGDLVLSGANTYTGTTTISAGTVTVGNGGSTGQLGTGNITNNAALVFNRTGTFSVTNIISGTGSFTKTNTGTLTLSGANTYTGPTTISAGTLTLGASNVIHDSSAVTINGGTLNLGTQAETLNSLTMSSGELQRGGAILTVTNASSITGGTLTFSAGGSDVRIDGALTLGGANFAYTGTGAASGGFRVGGNVTYGSGNSSAAVFTNTAGGTGRLNLNNGIRTFDIADVGALGSEVNVGWSVQNGGLIKTGAGVMTMTASNTYASGTTLNGGALRLGNNNALGTGTVTFSNGTIASDGSSARTFANNISIAGDVTFGDTTGTGTLTFSGTGTTNNLSATRTLTTTVDTTIAGAFTNTNGITKAGSGTLFLSNANSSFGTLNITAGTVNFQTNATITGLSASGGALALGGGTLTANLAGNSSFGQVISGAGNLTKTGAGTLTLSGANSFTGTLAVNVGGVTLNGGANRLASGASVSLAGGTLTLGGNESIGAFSGTSGTLALGANTFTTTSSADASFGGAITGSGGAFTKAGSGKLTLTASNSFTGLTTVSTGVLNIQHAEATGTTAGGISVTSGAALEIQGGITVGAEALTLNGTGVSSGGALRNISGNNTYGGAITLGSASRINSDADTLTLSGAIGGNTQNLTVGGAGNTTISGAIGTTTGTLTKADAGTLILSGANTYSGNTTVSAGSLVIGAGGTSGTLNNTAVSISNGASLTFNRSDDLTHSGTISGAGNFIKQGAGILTLTNAQTYTGTTTVSAGTLRFNATNTNTITTVQTGAKIGGSGSLGSVTVQTGGRLAPGNSPGILDVTALTLDAGSGYDWELDNVSGSAGTNWDLVRVGGGGGTVTINATSGAGNVHTVYIIGSGTGFSASNSYTWTLIDAGTLTNFAADKFAVSVGSIGGVTPSGTWTFLNTGGDLQLSYAPAISSYELTVGSGDTQTQSQAGGGAAQLTGSGWALNKMGLGTLVLTNSANDYTGTTTVKAGTLQINVNAPNNTAGALGAASSSVVLGDSGAATDATFNFGEAVDNARGINVTAGNGAANRVISTTIGSGTATQSGTVAASTNTTFSAASGGALLVSGVVSQGGALTISNSGTVAFTGINTYTGATTILNGSTLRVGDSSALGTTGGNTVVNSGGTLALSNGISTAEALNLNGTGVGSGGALRNVSGNNTVSGAVTLAGTTRINADSGTTLTLTGGVTGAGQSLTLGGAGNITISTSGVNTSSSGTLTIDSTGVVTITASGNYTGGTTLSAGTTRVGDNGAFGSGALNLNGGTLASDSGTARTIANSVTMGGNIILGEAATGTGALTLSGTVGLGSSTRSFTVNNTDSTLSGIVSGSGGITKLGTGNLTLSGVNTYSGTTTITAGKIIIGNNSGLGSGTVSLNGGALETDSTARTIANAMSLDVSSTIAGTGALTVNGTTTVTASSGLTNNSVGGLTLGNLTLGNSGVNRTLELRGTGNTTISGVVANSAAPNTGTLDIYSTGVTALNGANTYSGTTTVRSGATVRLGSASALGSTAGGTTVVSGGVLDLNGQTVGAEALSIGGAGISSGGALINSSANAASLSGAVTLSGNTTLTTSSGAITLSGAIGETGGARNLTKEGSGTLTLSGANTFTGTFTVSAGTVVAGNNAAFGTGSVVLADGTTISGDGSARTLSNNIDFQNLTVGGSGALTLSGTLTHSRAGPSTLTNNNNSGLTLGAINLANSTVNRVVTFAGTGNTTVTGVIANGGSTTASGITLDAGGATLTLSGANTYAGATTITAGTLVAANNSALGGGAGNTTVADGATLAFSNNITEDEAIAISGTGAGGHGALRNISGSNTNTGTVSLGASSTIKVDSGSTLQLGTIDTSTGTRNLTVNVDGTLRVTGALLNSTSITNVLQKDGVGELVISNNGTTGGLQLQVANGKVTLAAGSFSTNTSTTGSSASPRAIDLGISSTGNSVNNAAFYANSGVTVSNSIYVAPNASSALRTLGTESTGGAAATFNREIYLGGDLQVSAASGGEAVFSGGIVNSGALTKIGAGTVTLSGTNTFGGNVTVSEGTLSLSGGSALNDTNALTISGGTLNLASNETVGSIAGAGNITLNANQLIAGQNNTNSTFSGVMSGTGAFVKKGSGTLTLSGANTISGQLYLVGGATRFDVAQGATFTNTINLGEENGTDNATLVLGGNGITLANPITVRSGSSNNTLSIVATNSTGTATLSGAVAANKNVDLNVNSGGTLALSGNISGTNTIAKRGAGTAVLSGNNAGGLKYDLWAGELQAAAADDLGNNTGNFIANKLYFDGGTLGATGTFTLGDANGITLGGGGGIIRVGADQTLTLAGYMADLDQANLFRKAGAGTLFLNKEGVNDFSHTTLVIEEGTLSTWNPGLLSSTVQLGGSVSAGTYRFQKSDGGMSTGANFLLNAGGGQIDVGTDDLTVSGTVGGAGGLTKIGAGRLILSGTNTNSGGVTLSAGQLRLNSSGALGTGTLTQSGTNSTLEINTTGTISNAMSIYNVATYSNVTLSGNKTLNNATYDVATSTTTTESGTLSGDGGITKNGAGTLLVSGSTGNTFTGTSAVNAGTLQLQKTSGNAISGSSIAVNSGGTLLLGASNQIGDTTALNLAGGTFQASGNSDTIGKLTVSAGSIFDFGNTGGGTTTFTFSDFDVATYAGAVLTINNAAVGSSFVFNVDYSGNNTFSGGANSFASKIQFGTTGQFGQISFGGGQTTLLVAIPDARVYTAAVVLLVLIGVTEYRRRRRPCRR